MNANGISQRVFKLLMLLAMSLVTFGCAVSPEVQAKMDAYAQSIPTCASASDCESKWQTARNWAIENSDFPILTESEDRIMASSTLIGMSGIGVVVTRDSLAAGARILVDVECFSAYRCPDIWDLKLAFNAAVNADN